MGAQVRTVQPPQPPRRKRLLPPCIVASRCVASSRGGKRGPGINQDTGGRAVRGRTPWLPRCIALLHCKTGRHPGHLIQYCSSGSHCIHTRGKPRWLPPGRARTLIHYCTGGINSYCSRAKDEASSQWLPSNSSSLSSNCSYPGSAPHSWASRARLRSPNDTNFERCPTRNPRPARSAGAPLLEREAEEAADPPPVLELDWLPLLERELVRGNALGTPPPRPAPGKPPLPLHVPVRALPLVLVVLLVVLLERSPWWDPTEVLEGKWGSSSGIEVVEVELGKKCQPSADMVEGEGAREGRGGKGLEDGSPASVGRSGSAAATECDLRRAPVVGTVPVAAPVPVTAPVTAPVPATAPACAFVFASVSRAAPSRGAFARDDFPGLSRSILASGRPVVCPDWSPGERAPGPILCREGGARSTCIIGCGGCVATALRLQAMQSRRRCSAGYPVWPRAGHCFGLRRAMGWALLRATQCYGLGAALGCGVLCHVPKRVAVPQAGAKGHD